MPLPENIRLSDYTYHLPEEKIAIYPLDERDTSKLLVFKQGEIKHSTFRNIAEYLPDGALLVFNNTKVIPARLFFQKGEGGALIEIFLLNPLLPFREISQAMQINDQCIWACAVGNLKRWKEHQILSRTLQIGDKTVQLTAFLYDKGQQHVSFEWNNPEITFSELIEAAGVTPLPPYIKRQAEEKDKEVYQTTYAEKEGAVAAPTAGLHFTPALHSQLTTQGIQSTYLTLHVAGGTFQPVKQEDVLQHPMHAEQMLVRRANIEALLANPVVIPVGTTSMRTLESLYWFGVMLGQNEEASFSVAKLYPYQHEERMLPPAHKALQKVLSYMERKNIEILHGFTEIMIVPGYQFKICKGLITNFHQPGTTLMLLVAAFVGAAWSNIYRSALDNNYRFLSYGDSSLLLP